MIAMTTRRLALTTILGAVLIAAVAGLTLALVVPARGGAHEIELQRVDPDALAGFGRLLKPADRSPSLSAEAAVAAATFANKPDAKVLEAVLVRLVNDSRKPPLDKLAWAVNFDPTSIQSAPLYGPPGVPRVCDSHPEYDVVFIDAQTGELIFELTHTATIPEDDPAATCPPQPVSSRQAQ